MKKIISGVILSSALFVGAVSHAQLKVPAASSATSITQKIGIHTTALTYSRPNINGRKIFGGLVPYGSVWRLGANSIPNITFEETVTIEGNKVEAGKYGMFAIPDKDKWTIILSKKPEQWGSYQYNTADDYLRFSVKPQTLAAPVETYSMTFNNVTPNGAVLNISWERTAVNLVIKVDQKAEIMAGIDSAMATEKKPYFQAAQYYYDNGDIKKALEYVNEAEKASPLFYVKYWKAKIQLKAGDKAGAIATAKEGVVMAEKDKNQEYVNLNNEVIKAASK